MRLVGLIFSGMNLIFALGAIFGLVIVVALLIHFWVLGLVVLVLIIAGVGVGIHEGNKLVKTEEDDA